MNTQFSLGTKIKVGIIGFGRMGRFYWDAMRKSGRWDIAYICDTNPAHVNWQKNYLRNLM